MSYVSGITPSYKTLRPYKFVHNWCRTTVVSITQSVFVSSNNNLHMRSLLKYKFVHY